MIVGCRRKLTDEDQQERGKIPLTSQLISKSGNDTSVRGRVRNGSGVNLDTSTKEEIWRVSAFGFGLDGRGGRMQCNSRTAYRRRSRRVACTEVSLRGQVNVRTADAPSARKLAILRSTEFPIPSFVRFCHVFVLGVPLPCLGSS